MTDLTPVTDDVTRRLREALPAAALREVEPRHLEELRGKWHGQAALRLAPASTDEVATILSIASAARVPVVPYGGGTGLVAGQVRPADPAPLLLSFERLKKIRSVHPEEWTIVAEAGATLADIQEAAAEVDRLFPLSYASEGTAQIGASLAANAGGLNVLRYGVARDLCLGIEAVMADGSVLGGLKRLRKDNMGYDLRNLLVGAEGTLGVITAATLRLYPRPARVATALIDIRDPAAALELLARARDAAGETVSAFELISGAGLRFLAETGHEHRLPFETPPDWSVLIEIGTGPATDPEALVEELFVAAAEDGLSTDGAVARSEGDRQSFWSIRETIPEANRVVGAVASHDIALPLSEIPAFLEAMRDELAEIGPLRINTFGHLGDGNLHYNIFPPDGAAQADWLHLADPATRAIHDRVVAMGGTITAEHGIGRLKVDDLQRYGDPGRLAVMRTIKDALDPHGILNPGAVLPAK